jgi:deazaflavin-dependent oxidoreductase (nitroreductase family)
VKYAHAVPENQQSESFTTPTHDEIVELTKLHVQALETSNDDAVWVAAGMTHVLLTIIGRKSGVARKTPLPYWRDPNGHRIVVGSFAGAEKHPAWFHNLADKAANPTIHVKERDHEFWSDAEVLDGEEHEAMWAALTADRPFYDDYQAKTDRRIPLIRLPEPTG